MIAAYKVAAEGHDLQYFKNLLADHQRAIQQEAEEREAAAAEKAALKAQKEAAKEAAKEEKKKKRKSVAAETEDVEMADAEEGDKKAKTKKRKKDAGSDVEEEKVEYILSVIFMVIDANSSLYSLPKLPRRRPSSN